MFFLNWLFKKQTYFEFLICGILAQNRCHTRAHLNNPSLNSDTKSPHSAVGSALGYHYQPDYALHLLLKCEDDEAFVTLETSDDVELNANGFKELHQLKHSIKSDPKISISSRDLWSSLNVWSGFIRENDISFVKFILATVATLNPQSELVALTDNKMPRDSALVALETEAERVGNERGLALLKQEDDLANSIRPKSLPHDDKYKGCEAFLALDQAKRTSLVDTITIKPDSLRINDIQLEIEQSIKRTVPKKIRGRLAKLIIAWFEREVVESLSKERPREIYGSELRQLIAEKTAQLMDDELTDDSELIVPPDFIKANDILLKQLNLISATEKQIQRSIKSEWRARTQRGIWMEGRLSLPQKIKRYDDYLVEEWQDMLDESSPVEVESEVEESDAKKVVGQNLLNWSHFKAHQNLKPIRTNWIDPNLVRGSFQILSINRRIGWHPDYLILTADIEEE